MPTILVGAAAVGAADEVVRIISAAGEFTEVSGANISVNTAQTWQITRNQSPLSYDSAGVERMGAGVGAWTPILPQTVTAGAGGAPPATALIPLAAGDLIDVMLWWTVDTVAAAGQYEHNFATDPLGAVGGVDVVDPDWTAIILPAAAGETQPGTTWGHRMITTVVASAFGIANGAAADWPNDANVIFYGFYRYL